MMRSTLLTGVLTMRLLAALLLAFTIGAACPSASAADPASLDLRPIWKPGQTSRYQISQTELTRAATEGVGQPQESLTEITGQITWKADKIDENGGGTAVMTLDTLTMKLTGPEGQVIQVSDQRADSPEAKALQPWITAMVGSPLQVAVEPDGKIGSVQGWKAIQHKAGDDGAKLDELYFQEIAMDLAVLIGGRKDQAPGATWRHRYTGSHRMGKIDYDTTYELAGVETIAGVPVAVVQRSSQLKLEPDLGELPAGAPKITVKTRQADNKGQILFDTTRHEIVGLNIDQTLEIEVSMSIPGRTVVRTTRETTSTQILRIEEK
jgi:hypothetical protein